MDPEPSTVSGPEEHVEAEWTVHLLRESPRKGLGVGAAALLAALVGYWTMGSWVFAAVGAAMILSATAEFLLPIRYRLTNLRAASAYGAARLELRWDQVQRVLDFGAAVRLSPLARPSRLDPFRGVLVRFGPDESPGGRARVTAVIDAHAGKGTVHAGLG